MHYDLFVIYSICTRYIIKNPINNYNSAAIYLGELALYKFQSIKIVNVSSSSNGTQYVKKLII